MNLVDLVLGLAFAASIWSGWRRGLLLGGADLLALVGGVVAAFFLYPHAVAVAEQGGVQASVWMAPIAFLLLFLLIRVIIGVVLGRVVSAASQAAHAHAANRALGVIPGLGNGAINATILSMLLLAVPLSDGVTRAAGESWLASRLAVPAEWLEARLRPIFNPALDRTLTRLTVQPGSRERVKLPFTVASPSPRAELEARMLAMLNDERRAHGLPPLQADAEGTQVARAHSRDMFARGYFSHVTPEGEDPFARMRKGGMRFRAAGENLAFARTLPMAHQGLMNSPGHRANILRPQFGRVGIGIVDGGRYGLMVTQKFRN